MTEDLRAGRYRIEQEIGRGGMGIVYRARDTRLGRTVALKMLPAELTGDQELRRRLAQEARAASALNHPGIATVYDFEEHEGESFIVFEFVEGLTLRDRQKQKAFATDEILDLGAQLADALAAAHDRGVVHRDLKPENVMLTPGADRYPRAKILDFGLAKLRQALSATQAAADAETATIATARGLLVGTVNYMSPEQVEGEPADARSDIYSLGLVLYELATGTNPFVGKTPTSTIANILKQEPPPVTERNPMAPAELGRILHKCLRKRPEERYQSARELRVDLANLRQDSARSPAPPVVEPAPGLGAGVFSRGVARGLFVAIQAGYLAMYIAAFYNFENIAAFLDTTGSSLWPPIAALLFIAVLGTPVRLYLAAAVGADYGEIGAKYRLIFPGILVLDLLWSFSALLLIRKIGLLSLLCLAALLYLPFTQRRLLYDAYSPRGGRTSGIRVSGPGSPRPPS